MKEILEKISNFGNKKVTGINSIPLKILKLAKEPIAQYLRNINDLPFAAGIFPDSLKLQKITPICRKGSKLECSNYRPISLLSKLDKIEKLMHKIYGILK